MIRNVVMGKVQPDIDEDGRRTLEDGLAGIAGLDLPGMRANQIGRDAGLREGGWDFAIINDWDDADTYRAYDQDEEHNRYRAMIVGGCADLARVQFEL